MTTHMHITNPDAVEVTLTMTMTLADWRQLKEQIGSRYPAWKLGSKISSMVAQMGRHITPEAES